MDHASSSFWECVLSKLYSTPLFKNIEYTIYASKEESQKSKKYIMHCYLLVHSTHIRTRKTQRIY